METAITVNMLPDLLAIAALMTLAIYHLMIYWGRKKDFDEAYNLYFSAFVFSTSLFIVAPYFQPQYFLYAFKPPWLTVMNIEALMVLCLFFSGIKFINLLLKVSEKLKRYFYFTYASITLNFFLTFISNIYGADYYYKHILPIILLIVLVNTILIYIVYGYWVYREKLYKERFYQILYFGFVSLTANILIYRSIELLTIPKLLVFNHYISATILYIFAYALSVKFNKEYFELKELKISLEKKVEDRTAALEKSNRLLEQQNIEIENQKMEIISINQELSMRADELFSLNQARSRFFTNISHEFRTPLTLIIGPLENLLSQVTDNKIKEDYELMLRQSKRLLALVNQLLALSKLQKGMQTLTVVNDNLNIFIQAILDSYRALAHELKIQLTFIEESEDIKSWFDKDKIEKIVTNLVTNALKFTNTGGSVEVQLNHLADQQLVELVVRDTGIGIEPEKLKNIFDPFYQIDSSVSQRFEGSGIGLSLVKELIVLHHGTIRVTSQVQQGTTFTIKIPATESAYTRNEIVNFELDEAEEVLEVSNTEYQPSSNKQAVILLVEDNQEMRTYIKTNLPSSYQVIEATNGQEGFDLANEWMPDLIITDIMMPVINGLEMTRSIKQDERTSHIPVIMLTAKASTENKLEGLGTQADDYITKPFNGNELLMRVQNLLANRERLREKFSKSITVNPSELVTTSVDEKFLQKALQIVETNMSEAELSAEKFCDEIAMSRAHVHRKLKSLTGQSASHFIRSIKLKRAAQLLRQNAGSVSEIAYQTGFNNLSYFTRCFKEQYGALPSSYITTKEDA